MKISQQHSKNGQIAAGKFIGRSHERRKVYLPDRPAATAALSRALARNPGLSCKQSSGSIPTRSTVEKELP
jgi:hypothetical protein